MSGLDPENFDGIVLRLTKKSRSTRFHDLRKEVEQCAVFETDDFWFVFFVEPNERLKRILDIAGTWRSTKIWLYGDEMPKYTEVRWKIQSTLFCKYRGVCNGNCQHPMRFGFSRYWHEEQMSELPITELPQSDIECLKTWLESGLRSNDASPLDRDQAWENRRTLKDLIQTSIATVSEELDVVSIDHDKLRQLAMTQLNFELKYCSLISQSLIDELISSVPSSVAIPKAIRDLPTTDEIEGEGDEEPFFISEKLTLSEETIVKLGEELERRLRNVLNEFLDREKL